MTLKNIIGTIETKEVKTAETTKVKYYRNDHTFIYSIEVEGHVYIVFDGYHEGGIIHAEHCPCKMKCCNPCYSGYGVHPHQRRIVKEFVEYE